MQDIINLLKEYKTFKDARDSSNLAEFGRWLFARNEKVNLGSSGQPEVDSHGLNAMVSYLMGGMIGYTEAWLKVTFHDLPVVSLIDFGILKTVELSGNPSKTEIADKVIAERTTTIESIKRMVSLGLLKETEDKDDKRVRRVSLTEKGKKLLLVLNKKMIALGNLLVGDLSRQEKNQFGVILKKLNQFHATLYRAKDRAVIKAEYSL